MRSPSLNPTVLGDIPRLPANLAGTAARDWLTTWSIARSMAARPEVLAALTALVATLSTGPGEARRARPDWPEQHWDRWRSVRTVVIGGGLVRGALGVHIVDRAAALLRQLGVDLTITRAADAAELGLRGAASRLLGTGVALDCGGTAIKRAWVSRGPDGQRVEPLTPVAAPGRVGAHEVIDRIAEATAGAAEVAEVAEVAVGARDQPVEVVLAIATYVDGLGQPYAGQLGPYAPLGKIDFRAALAEAIGRRVKSRVSVTVIHDGAAALLGGRIEQPDTDVAIMLGTAIGCSLTPDIR